MHDSTRRLICRVAFVAICLIPSSSLCAWIIYRATPVYAWQLRTFWEQTIYRQTGMLTSIERASHPTNHKTLLEQVSLTDRDGGRQLGRIRAVEIAKTDRGLVAIVSQPEIEKHQLRRLSEILYTTVLRGPQPATRTELVIGDVTLHSSRGATTLSDVNCIVDASDTENTQVTLDFLLAGGEQNSLSQLRVTRHRNVTPLKTEWHLRTGAAPLPCALLADYLAIANQLGPDCRFQGTAWIESDGGDWNGEVTGRFTSVQLEQLMKPFPHKLSGNAEVLLSHSRFQHGRITELAGSLQSDGGVVSRSLLEAAGEFLQLDATPPSSSGGDTLLAYSKLAFGFQIDEFGMQLSGQCDDQTPDVLLVGNNGQPFLKASPDVTAGVALVRALVPQSEVQVPATQATEALLRALPLPAVEPPAARTAEQPYSPLRMRK